MIDYTKSAQLKEEGNKLYAQKSYAQAYVKYTCAIGEDANNAVLFANRAACSLAEKKYRLAADDAEKATMLDPGYAKAWARLATAQDVLSGGVKSAHAWQKALDSLPKSGLTPSEQKQKEQYQSGLQSAKESQVIRMTGGNGKAPWDRAEAMRPELMERRYEMVNSSAWVILNAYKEFKDGVSDMMKVKKVQTPQGTALGGKFGALAGITNGIIRDERVFHIESNEWTPKYNDQVCLEAQQSGAWVNVKSEGVIKEAPARLRQQGWDKLRPALSVTVRAWMMRGFMEGGTRGAYSIAVSFFGECLEVLDWGRRVWKDVPVEDKGVIFKDTFIRAVRSLHLSAFMQAHDQDPGPNSKYPLEDLLAEADEILCDVLSHPPPTEGEYDPGFILSFYVYPAGLALSMKGFYHARTAQLALKEHDIDAAKDHYRKAGDFYIDAANKYPEDDEQHAYFLNCGVENFFKCGTPLRTNLALLKRIRLAVPKMRRIWSDSAMSKQGRDEIFDRALENEKMLLDAIQSGQFTLDDKVMPKWE